MSMKGKRSTVMLRVSALTALATASLLGAAVFFAAGPAEGAENNTHQLLEVTTNEEAEGSEVDPTLLPDERSSANSGHTDPTTPKHCYITVAFDDAQPEIHPSNTIKVNGEICNEIGIMVFQYYYEAYLQDLE